MQSGVTSTAAKFGTVTTKAWSDLNSAIQSKGGYDSVSGSNSVNSFSNQDNNKHYNDFDDQSSSYSKIPSSTNNNKKTDWNWEDSSWNDSNSDKKATRQFKNDADNEKWSSLDDDNWEPIEQVTKSSLNKK